MKFYFKLNIIIQENVFEHVVYEMAVIVKTTSTVYECTKYLVYDKVFTELKRH